jgi:hypothetical protein
VTTYLQYNDPLKILWRTGTAQDPYVPKTTTQKIINGKITLDEIPNEFDHVLISGYSEIYTGTPTETQFIVNYTNGVVTFNSINEGTTIIANYYGRGIILYPAERIYVHNANPDIVISLQDLIESGSTSGDVTSVTSANTDIGVQNSTSDVILTLNSGNSIGQIPKVEMDGKISSTIIPSLDYIPTTEKGVANGVATLDADGKILSTIIPSLNYISTSEKGTANGVATLDSNSKLSVSILPNSIAKNNYIATVDPTVNDDSADGYSIGSEWKNSTNGKLFKCYSVTIGSAIWQEFNSGSGTETLAEEIITGVDIVENFNTGAINGDGNWVPTGWTVYTDEVSSYTIMDANTTIAGVSPVFKMHNYASNSCFIHKSFDFTNIWTIKFLMIRESAASNEYYDSGFRINIDNTLISNSDDLLVEHVLGNEEFYCITLSNSYTGLHDLSIDVWGDCNLWLYNFTLSTKPIWQDNNIISSINGISGNRLKEVLPNLKNYVDGRTHKNNYEATTDPTTSNDGTQGYGKGSEWLNTTDGGMFKCINSATGTAIWKEITFVI